MKRNSKLYLLLVTGMLSAFGPFVTDFYLPALPRLSEYFGSSASVAQLSLTVCLFGLAFGQLIAGPLSDRYGRRAPLLWSLAPFTAATAGCIAAPSAGWFILFRLLQGVAGAGGVVISKSVATDLYRGRELASFFSMLVCVQGIAPIAAPVLGGVVLGLTDWHGIFRLLLALGVLLLAASLRLRESLAPQNRQTGGGFNPFTRFLPALRNRKFMGFVLIQAFAMGVMFTYIAASPFIFQEHYGLSPLEYGLCFALNALGIMAGGVAVSRFGNTARALGAGVRGFAVAGVVTAGILAARLPFLWTEAALLVLMVCLGIILPSSTALAMELERDSAGNASAILGAFQFLFGGALSPLAGMGNIFTPTAAIVGLCCLCTAGCFLRLGRHGATSA